MSESRSMQRRKAAQKGEPMPTFSPEPAYTEQDLREAKSFFSFGSSRTCLHCGYDSVATDVSEKELAAEFARIRSEARAGMREACAKECERINNMPISEYLSISDGHENEGIEECCARMIRSLPDLAADEAIERIKVEAVAGAMAICAHRLREQSIALAKKGQALPDPDAPMSETKRGSYINDATQWSHAAIFVEKVMSSDAVSAIERIKLAAKINTLKVLEAFIAGNGTREIQTLIETMICGDESMLAALSGKETEHD